ncbi:hypothetical protein FRC15_008646 [Serendipita sp. 397]|nr:hypothetical protein FRC15_008646 [Serendipita sp. 397]
MDQAAIAGDALANPAFPLAPVVTVDVAVERVAEEREVLLRVEEELVVDALEVLPVTPLGAAIPAV